MSRKLKGERQDHGRLSVVRVCVEALAEAFNRKNVAVRVSIGPQVSFAKWNLQAEFDRSRNVSRCIQV